MARSTIKLAGVFLLILGSICSAAQTPAADSSRKLSAPGLSQQLRIDTSRMILTDSFNRVIGLIDRSGQIRLLDPASQNRFGWMYSFIMGLVMIVLICLGIVIIAATVRFVFGKKKKQKKKEADSAAANDEDEDEDEPKNLADNWKYNITKIISLVLLGSFVLALVSLFFVNLESGERDPVNEKWFEIFKTMLLLLGTSFTTIMGYFFGQAQSANLEKKKDKLEKEKGELEEANRDLNDVTTELSRQIDVIATPTLNEEIRQEPLSPDPASGAQQNP